jgi:HTH-type transcriptional regulator / antitoxin HigA
MVLDHIPSSIKRFATPDQWSESDYEIALSVVEHLLLTHSDETLSNESADPRIESIKLEIEVLAKLVSQYETKHFPVREASLHEIIQFLVEERGGTAPDIEALFDTPQNYQRYLHREHTLTLAEAKRLHHTLGVSAELILA